MRNEIIVLCGKSSTGKDTIANELSKLGYNFIVSHTTRPKRSGEMHGKPYWFIDDFKMRELKDQDKLLEIREYNTLVNNIEETWYYAVHKDAVMYSNRYVVVLDSIGLEAFKEHFGDRVQSFHIRTPDKVRTQRAKDRGSFDISEWNRRLKADKQDFKNIICDYTVRNSGNKYICLGNIIEQIGKNLDNKIYSEKESK